MNSKLVATISIIIMIGIIIAFITSIFLESHMVALYGFLGGVSLLLILAVIDSRRR